MERDHLFEEVEQVVTRRSVREVCDGRRTGPGDDADQEDTDEDRTLDTIQHQHHCEDPAGTRGDRYVR